MALEIERKFLVINDSWRDLVTHSETLIQGYVNAEHDAQGACVRVRSNGTQGWLTLKGESKGCVRHEFEYPIAQHDADSMLTLFCATRQVRKKRHTVVFSNTEWVVDCFTDALAPLVVTEIELPSSETTFSMPPWLGAEVTSDPRFSNYCLAHTHSSNALLALV